MEDMDFDEYVAARGPAFERYAFVLTGDLHRSQDIVQTALVKAHHRWRWVVRADQPDAYVRRIVTRTYLDWRRRRSSHELPVQAVPDLVGADPAEEVAQRDQVRRALAMLSPKQRAVLVLRHYEGYDGAMIAAVIGCSEGTVRTHASRGAQRLLEALKSMTEELR